jgi:glycosylphosphatidylinositol transamidase
LIYAIGLVTVLLLPHPIIHDDAQPDEKALLIGQVSRYFGVADLIPFDGNTLEIASRFEDIGLDVSVQNFEYQTKGTNVHGIFRPSRGEGTEAMVLIAPVNQNQTNSDGLQLLLSFATFAQRYSYWSKDIIFLVTDGEYGPYAWLEAYHGHLSKSILD